METLAIKYRPKTWEDVTEQTNITTILKNQINTNTIKNAYLFCGGAGTGKTTCARIFANEINKGQGSPIELDAASNNGVDDVREIGKKAKTKSIDSVYKIFIIDECHALSNSAWQSMLKLIEEPPMKTIFIFCTTDPQKIPKTILSRVQRYDFKRISKQGIVDRLEYILTNEHLLTSSGDPQLDGDTFIDVAKGLEYIARLSDGGMRDAITMLDKCISYNEDITLESVLSALNLQSQDTMVELTNLILDGDETLLNLLDDIYMSGTDIKQFTRDYLNFVFDVKKSIILGDIDKTHLVYTDELKALLKKAGNKKLDTLLNRLIKLVSEIKFDMYPKYLIEYTLLEVANWKN